jgi:hypothetical protein
VFSPTPGAPYVHHTLTHGCGNSLSALQGMNLKINQPFPCQSSLLNDEGSSPLGLYALLQSYFRYICIAYILSIESCRFEGDQKCPTLLYASAPGTSPLVVPPAAGFRVGQVSNRYVVIEAHISNPNLVVGVNVTSLVKLHFTSTLRANDAQSLILGNLPTNFPPIFPNAPSVHLEATCPSACTKGFTGNLNVFSSMLHMHLIGKQIWSSKYSSAGNLIVLKHLLSCFLPFDN